MGFKCSSLGLLVAVSFVQTAIAGDSPRNQSDLFETHVRPVIVAHCIKCHGESKQEGDLRLTTLDELVAGGASGPAIVPGSPAESLLLEALRYESYEMPPSGKLDDEQIAGIEAWIAAGAHWPEGVVLAPAPVISEDDRDWWCYQPITDPPVPNVNDNGWSRNEIDRFVFERLTAEGMTPAAEASPRTLVRRLSYTLTGLPPDAESLAGVQTDEDLDALIDRLLDSPAYGENQARFWLDLVRYAESDGYRADAGRPHASKYRDYVIRSFNADKPYDRFITEQIAGDEVDPGNADAIVATMYLRHWIYEHNQRDVEGQWAQIIDDITETTADVFIAQGLKCARCHDHKFDPILQQDYYRFRAFFEAFQPREDMPVADVATRTKHYEQQQAWEAATETIRRRLREIELPALHAHTTGEGIDKFVDEIRAMIEKPVDERTPYEHQIASLASRQFKVHPEKLPEWLDAEAEAERQRLLKELATYDDRKPDPLPTMAFVASDVGPVAPPTKMPGSEAPIEPGFLTILDDAPATIPEMPEALQTTGRRTALANWLTGPDNPLTARVIVNRVWQQHFGRGLVESSSDYGRLGTPPSHPELLDWLAKRFVEDGWSLKALHRRILTSSTYRQRSRRPDEARLAAIDPDNRLLWRMNPRRLSGEEIVDTILAATGKRDSRSRAIFQPVKRNSLDPLLVAFDFPDRITSNCERYGTTTSTQALVLANNPWSHDRAREIAERLWTRNNGPDRFIEAAYASLFSRSPESREFELAAAFLHDYAERTPAAAEPDAGPFAMMPATGSRAIDLAGDGAVQVGLPAPEQLPAGDFTVEAVVLLRSLYADASVRTIATHWSGNNSEPGWSFGVTSTKSSYQPRNVILQLIGKTDSGEAMHYEVVASGLRPELNKPYYLAVSVNLKDTSEKGVTFLMKDLSTANSKLQTAYARHSVTHGIRPDRPLQIGGRDGGHLWDGLIDGIRIASGANATSPVAVVAAEGGPDIDRPADLVDLRFDIASNPGFDSSPAANHAWIKSNAPRPATPDQRARTALIHALLNSNELIYVD